MTARVPVPDTCHALRGLAGWHFQVFNVSTKDGKFQIDYMDRSGKYRQTKPAETEARAWWLLCGEIPGIKV